MHLLLLTTHILKCYSIKCVNSALDTPRFVVVVGPLLAVMRTHSKQ
jgi:hypothetical protein